MLGGVPGTLRAHRRGCWLFGAGWAARDSWRTRLDRGTCWGRSGQAPWPLHTAAGRGTRPEGGGGGLVRGLVECGGGLGVATPRGALVPSGTGARGPGRGRRSRLPANPPARRKHGFSLVRSPIGGLATARLSRGVGLVGWSGAGPLRLVAADAGRALLGSLVACSSDGSWPAPFDSGGGPHGVGGRRFSAHLRHLRLDRWWVGRH